MFILGISAFYHDSAACLVKDGEIIAAAQEERFTRIKHDAAFPANSIRYCLHEAKIDPEQISNIVFYEKPFIKFERLLETYLAFAPRGFKSFFKSMPIWIKDKLFQKNKLNKELNSVLGKSVDWRKRLLFSEHHLSHAASAFYPSPFERAAVITLDGVGEWTTTSFSVGNKNELKVIKEIKFPHSLGLLYSAFTYYIGFKVNSGEYKLMGLAPYGEPIYVDKIKENLISIADDGSFQLNMNYFDFATGLKMTNKKFDKLFGGPSRDPESKISQREMDIAASIQKITEEIVVKISKNVALETGEKNLCLAGGVALNCVVNGIIFREKIFENIWIQPASGDAGGALGACLAAWFIHHKKNRKLISKQDSMKGAFLGPKFSDSKIEAELIACKAIYKKISENDFTDIVVNFLIEKKAIGWMQGRMEFGPRALGSRSIIADPRSPTMQKQLNLKIKYRESFRPFAPSILSDYTKDWFEDENESPYMLMVSKLKENHRKMMNDKDKSLFGIDKLNIERSSVPAITHVDYSARIQTVHYQTNPRFHSLLSKFNEKTGCPIVVNTSFNVRGEPIVCSPTDAFKCFMNTDLDILCIQNYILLKEEQDDALKINYTNKYDLD